MKIKPYQLVLLVCALILLVSGFLIGRLTIADESKECLTNPLVYSVKVMEDLNHANFSCGCSSLDSNIDPFYFDDKGIYQKNPVLGEPGLS